MMERRDAVGTGKWPRFWLLRHICISPASHAAPLVVDIFWSGRYSIGD